MELSARMNANETMFKKLVMCKALALTNERGIIELVNQTFARLLGYSSEEIIGWCLSLS